MKETTEVGEGKLFSPGNLRATFDNPDYDKVSTLIFPDGGDFLLFSSFGKLKICLPLNNLYFCQLNS